MSLILYFDGSSKPTGCGAGVSILDGDSKNEVYALSFPIPKQTNNYAEYMGLIKGLEEATRICTADSSLCVRGDSLLVINQMKGVYKVKSENLRSLHERAVSLAGHFRGIVWEHVYRDGNKRADQLANEAADWGRT